MDWLIAHAADIVIAAALAYHFWSGWKRGFVIAALDVAGFVAGLAVALAAYPHIGKAVADAFGLTRMIAGALGFMGAWVAVEALYPLAANAAYKKIPQRFTDFFGHKPLGAVVSMFGGTLLAAIFLSTAVALPFPAAVKRTLTDSTLGGAILRASARLDTAVAGVFGGAARETLNLLTIKPDSGETVKLGFTTERFAPDKDAEFEMLALLNAERKERGLAPLALDLELVATARSHSADMLRRGYFSHTSPEGLSPADRADAAGIEYRVFGENLAFAPDVALAHDGLMNSPGHRANILSTDYSRIGIGIQDAGVYGLMITQHFAR